MKSAIGGGRLDGEEGDGYYREQYDHMWRLYIPCKDLVQ